MREERSRPAKASTAPEERVELEPWSHQTCTLSGNVLSAH